jgi:hypothetical protein
VRAPSEDRVRVRNEMLQLLSLCWTNFDFAGGYLLEKGCSSSLYSVEEGSMLDS